MTRNFVIYFDKNYVWIFELYFRISSPQLSSEANKTFHCNGYASYCNASPHSTIRSNRFWSFLHATGIARITYKSFLIVFHPLSEKWSQTLNSSKGIPTPEIEEFLKNSVRSFLIIFPRNHRLWLFASTGYTWVPSFVIVTHTSCRVRLF